MVPLVFAVVGTVFWYLYLGLIVYVRPVLYAMFYWFKVGVWVVMWGSAGD